MVAELEDMAASCVSSVGMERGGDDASGASWRRVLRGVGGDWGGRRRWGSGSLLQ